MPQHYLRQLIGPQRTRQSNLHLAYVLTFTAGAVNAGGFLAVGQYTSHMSGVASSAADALGMMQLTAAASGASALAAFVLGAALSAMLVNWGRRGDHTSVYAAPLLVEATALAIVGLGGATLLSWHWLFAPAAVAILCFAMGLQNAMVTKLSGAEIRTTHITGMVTDIGIELGKAVYWNRLRDRPRVRCDIAKLRLLTTLVGIFFIGGVAGALGFKEMHFMSSFILAGGLLIIAVFPIADDLRSERGRTA